MHILHKHTHTCRCSHSDTPPTHTHTHASVTSSGFCSRGPREIRVTELEDTNGKAETEMGLGQAPVVLLRAEARSLWLWAQLSTRKASSCLGEPAAWGAPAGPDRGPPPGKLGPPHCQPLQTPASPSLTPKRSHRQPHWTEEETEARGWRPAPRQTLRPGRSSSATCPHLLRWPHGHTPAWSGLGWHTPSSSSSSRGLSPPKGSATCRGHPETTGSGDVVTVLAGGQLSPRVQAQRPTAPSRGSDGSTPASPGEPPGRGGPRCLMAAVWKRARAGARRRGLGEERGRWDSGPGRHGGQGLLSGSG